MGHYTSYDVVIAGLLALSLVVNLAARVIDKTGSTRTILGPFVPFIAKEDIEVSLAEEEVDQSKLKIFSGDATVKVISPGEVPVASTLPTAVVTESFPLLKATNISYFGRSKPHSWKTIVLSVIGLVEAVGHAIVLVDIIVDVAKHTHSPEALTIPAIFLSAWIYATLSPLVRPKETVPFGVLVVHLLSLVSSLIPMYVIALHLDSVLVEVHGNPLVHTANVLLTSIGIIIIMTFPLNEYGKPKIDEDGRLPAMDDFTSLYEWLSFNWMTEFVSIGTTRPVEEADVWQLSNLLRTRVLMTKFRQFKRKTLLRRVLSANALDLSTSFIFTLASALLSVSQPVLLNLTLRALEDEADVSIATLPLRFVALSLPQTFYAIPAHLINSATLAIGIQPSSALFLTPMRAGDSRQMAYFYATIAFIFQLVKAQTSLQHLYHSRRASVRMQSELVGCIYEKSLVRKDITGAIASDAKKQKSGEAAEAAKDAAVESADVGKIVSLIATDASECASIALTLSRLYEIPVYFVGSCWLLYNLMGWTAFIGYVAFLFAMPVNWIIMASLRRLKETLLDVRDKRMREMNQLVHAIKFIKFFSWESKWVDRVMEARKREMNWLRKFKWLSFAMTFFWDVVPLLVTVISFVAYILIGKGKLTIAIAFPALSAFSILTQSVTMIPMMANDLIETNVSAVRIQKYLEEDEVPEWVSWQSQSRMGTPPNPSEPFDKRVGFVNANFAWLSPNKRDAGKKMRDATDSAASNISMGSRIRWLFKKDPKTINREARTADEENEERDKPFELRNIDLMFNLGALNLISGPTGSGKSSLLSALIGEMHCTSGEVHLPRSPLVVDYETGLRSDVSYCAQQPWLQHQSIRDNILFGHALDEIRYRDVLRVCQLTTDLDLLDGHDLTEIGEKGVSLSGGQKARVALARAVYSRSQTVILDDVLSAVDSHTAEKLITECLCGPIMSGRTIILVTHHVDLIINHCAYVVQLEEGAIVSQGTPDELRASGRLTTTRETAVKEEIIVGPLTDGIATQGPEAETQAQDKLAHKLVEKEKKAEGRVKFAIYHVYISAVSYSLMCIALGLVFLHYAGEAAQKFWIRFWGESYDVTGHISFDLPNPKDNVWPYLGGYVAFQILTALITIISQIPSIYGSLRASRELYRNMLLSVIRAPSRWFDKTPSARMLLHTGGRILNRFSKDINTVDSNLQWQVQLVIETGLASLVTIATILYGTPLFIFPLLIIAALQIYISRGYISFSRDMRRIESNTRSPMIASFSELVNGIATVRAFGAERFMMDRTYKRLDRVQAAFYYYWMGNRWLLYRLDSMGAFVVLFATLISISSGISSGMAGIVISSSTGLIMNLYWLIRFYTDVEQSMNSVERVHEYMDIPSEPAAIIKDHRPPAYWPSSAGGVSVENLVLKYSPEMEPVLHGVSFDIKPAEKIGLVGRTGSGKSTLALGFFRFVDPAEGKIIIDGIDITTIGLQDLRSRLTIIPQDAVLFSGTIRDNLDPFNEYTDEECLDALGRAQLRTSASPTSTANPSRQNSRPSTPAPGTSDSPTDIFETVAQVGGNSASTLANPERTKVVITLDTQVSEGGSNFSAGQRQLIAMARALLRRSRFVVMDESTASVDFATDMKIQQAIREEFKESILITIAHRLRTIIDYDRVLVLDAGKVAEFDTPQNLLAKEDGIFRTMCIKSGDFDELKSAADNHTSW
ncbi:P-loop containing nucleoside triphosphate hydrolase protein [Clavulina sp. PMI_390]|nr:P-loop containing nucleoside triphosphate hydrolase protein [Clavulina sp. PMI_390]